MPAEDARASRFKDGDGTSSHKSLPKERECLLGAWALITVFLFALIVWQIGAFSGFRYFGKSVTWRRARDLVVTAHNMEQAAVVVEKRTAKRIIETIVQIEDSCV